MASRNWIFTSFNLDINTEEVDELVRYLAWQVEKCPETGKKHIQGYIELHKPRRLNAMKELLGDEKIHLEKRRGTREQARDYCMKEETRIEGPYEYGTWAVQGKRNDIENAYEAIKNGDKWIDIQEEYPVTYCKYNRGLEKMKFNYEKELTKGFRNVECNVIWGEAGAGKTRSVVENNEDLYITSDLKWWDGYDGENAILIDDFEKGKCAYTELLRIMDGYQLRLPIKGGFTWAKWTKVYITSNDNIESWFPERVDFSALERRIASVTEVNRDRSCEVILDSQQE